MPRQRVRVELSTPRGRVFSGLASSIELRTVEGLIAITPWEKSYLSLVHTTEITVRIGNEFHAFIMENATASLSEGRLTVLAEEIRPAETAAMEAADPTSCPGRKLPPRQDHPASFSLHDDTRRDNRAGRRFPDAP